MTPEEILHEAARQGIKSLVDVMSTSISVEAKRTRMTRIMNDLDIAIGDSKEAEQ